MQNAANSCNGAGRRQNVGQKWGSAWWKSVDRDGAESGRPGQKATDLSICSTNTLELRTSIIPGFASHSRARIPRLLQLQEPWPGLASLFFSLFISTILPSATWHRLEA